MPPPRHKSSLVSPALAFALLLALLTLGACGGSDGITHIQGSSETITKPMLDHWMRADVATDFRANIGTKAPTGLAAEPANQSECAQAAKTVIPRSYTGQSKLTDAEIAQKCHQLYIAIRNQAMSYLLSAQWTKLEAKELGVRLSEPELHKEFLRSRKETYGNQATFLKYMRERRLVLSDVLYLLTRNILVTRILPKFEARVKHAGGGEKVYAKLALVRYHGLIAKTSCKAGYVMEDCKEYREPPTPLSSPDVILEGFVQGLKHV
jgi:hypothetical protein